jgi:1-acyl-sn-glycerol-3-phosphate acyltransferase
MEHLPKHGGALLVCNHSLATYDISLLLTAIYADLGRYTRPLIDRLFFKVPYLGEIMTFFGAVQGSPEAADKLLKSGELVTVAPGGMREALRPSSERYQIRWDRRFGFARLAMRANVPVILAACPRADDLYDVYPSHLTAWFYRTFRVPVFLARGIGPTPVPRPIKLVHYLSEPIMPPPWSDDEAEREPRVERFHAQLVERMHELIGEAIQHREG